ncbi:hypothetical protein [Variovorax sp. MHTC-1]|uniref:hypothetical protein n=1 Tax=Variovorax sp. MHTC-1 TaxID=2495593 RepID=UPI00163BE8B0|nr:hypothetical protein [Variovorax sp. MHTC-1]
MELRAQILPAAAPVMVAAAVRVLLAQPVAEVLVVVLGQAAGQAVARAVDLAAVAPRGRPRRWRARQMIT